MEEPAGYVYKPYPRRLYENGDPAAASIVVDDAGGEDIARARGFRKAWEPATQATIEVPKFGSSAVATGTPWRKSKAKPAAE
jgi:hypothetical protein